MVGGEEGWVFKVGIVRDGEGVMGVVAGLSLPCQVNLTIMRFQKNRCMHKENTYWRRQNQTWDLFAAQL